MAPPPSAFSVRGPLQGVSQETFLSLFPPLPAVSHPAGNPAALSMFRCQVCRKAVPPGTACQRLVIQTRPKKYPYRSRANRIVRLSESGKLKEVYVDDPGGEGR